MLLLEYINLFPIILISISLAVLITSVVFIVRKKSGIKQALTLFLHIFVSVCYCLMAGNILFKVFIYVPTIEPASHFLWNLIPFKTIVAYMADGNLIQLLGNILVIFPLPILLWVNFRKWRFTQICAVSFIITALIEPVQLAINFITNTAHNVIDIDDLIVNLLGVGLGLFLLKIITVSSPQQHTEVNLFKQNENCPCANKSCLQHGLCAECNRAHKGKTFCKSPKWKQNLVKFFVGKKDTNK
ncbi:VanZ family protein [Lachnospiraceae bacterium ZAX-1]